VQYRQREAALELDLELDSRPGVQWWVRLPRLYCHYTSFAECRLRWRWGGEQGELTTTALHDHGWGRHALPLRLSPRLFRYEVLRLSDGGHVAVLRTDGPLGVPLRAMGVRRDAGGRMTPLSRLRWQVLDRIACEDHQGRARVAARRWLAVLYDDTR
jgi:hypothetical protein